MIDLEKIGEMEICEIEDLIDILFSKVEEKRRMIVSIEKP